MKEMLFEYRPLFYGSRTLVKGSPVRRKSEKIGRNDPCPCGSGKKVKKCCWDDFHRSVNIDGSILTKMPPEALDALMDDLKNDAYGGGAKNE